MAKTKKESQSRSARCGRACDKIREIAGELRTIAEEANQMAEDLPEEGDTITLAADAFSKMPLEEATGDGVGELEELKDELQSWFDNLPESLQQGDTGTRLEEAVSNLESAIDTIGAIDWPAIPSGEVTAADLTEFAGTVDETADNLDGGCDEAESTEFPGMYGK